MATIIPDLMDTEPVPLEEVEAEETPTLSFKTIIDHLKTKDSTDPFEEDDQNSCIISVFELPRSHFSIPDEKEEPSGSAGVVPLTCAPLPASALEISPISSSQSVGMPDEIEALFEKMAESMLLISSEGRTETTLFLDSPQFDHSPFYGTRITIQEFSTAPKAFNVEIAASSWALMQIDTHKAALLTAFAKGDFGFSIHRLDTELQETDHPLFQRKEAVSQDDEEEQQ
jgi:hypothetical protein